MNQGDYAIGSLVDFKFATRDASGVPTALAGTPTLGVYKANSTTESTAGITLTIDFDLLTGLNHVRIDTSADGTFYASGNDFDVIITAGTVGGTSVVGQVVGSFSLENRSALRPATAGRTVAVATDHGVTLADGVAHGGVPGSSTTTIAVNRFAISNNTSDPAFSVTNSGGDAGKFVATGGGGSGLVAFGHASAGGAGIYAKGNAGARLWGSEIGGVGLNLYALASGNAGLTVAGGGVTPGSIFFGGDTSGPAVLFTTFADDTGGNGGNVIELRATDGHGVAITSAGSDKHDIALLGSGDMLGGVTLTDGSITSAKFTIAPITGPATGILEQIRQTWRAFFKKSTKTASKIKTYADDGSTVITDQDISSASGTDTRGPAT